MVEQLRRPTEQVEVFWFSEQPNGYVTDEDLNKYDSGRLGFPNTHFDPMKAHVLYNEYHEQYALADEVGFDGIMTNEHHAAYWCMKPCVNLDAAVISKLTKRVKIAAIAVIRDRGDQDALGLIDGLQKTHPDVPVFLAALDSYLNEVGYIVPGLGDAGDRQFGTI